MSVAGKLVVIAGATSAAGIAVARELTRAGARVVAVSRDAGKLREVADAGGEVGALSTEVCDLTDEAAVAQLAARVHTTHGNVDGIVHLVGGWRGGGGLAGQSEADYRFIEASFTALRHISRAFDSDLKASQAGRLAVVSSTAVARPLAASANYVAVKAATEAWARAVAQGFAKHARDAGREVSGASAIFRVNALDGLEAELARRCVGLWDVHASQLNDAIIDLSTTPAA